MTPEEALAVLDTATSQMTGTREAHAQISLAIETLRIAITKPGRAKSS